jgi:hypothetical protein
MSRRSTTSAPACPAEVIARAHALAASREALETRLLECRFFEQLEVGRANQCWPYLGSFYSARQPQFWCRRRKRQVRAQRVVLEIALGEALPWRRPVVSTCGSPVCCNPAHLRFAHEARPRLLPGAYRPPAAPVREASIHVDQARFWARADRTGGPAACWPWTGSPDRHGYGHGIRQRAHRIACEFAHGPLNGRWALHHGDNPTCCNPGHLYPGTASDNARDRVRRGRDGKPNQKLTDAEVSDLRWRYERGASFEELAEHFEITVGHAKSLARGHSRPEVGGPIAPSGHRSLKASDATVREIREIFAARWTRRNFMALAAELGERFGLTQRWVLRIVRGEVRLAAGGPIVQINYW